MEGGGDQAVTFCPISDAELAEAFKFYRWGEGVTPKPREMMAVGLLQRASGFAIGGTLSSCLVELRLLAPKSRKLTKRGQLVLWDCFVPFTEKGSR